MAIYFRESDLAGEPYLARGAHSSGPHGQKLMGAGKLKMEVLRNVGRNGAGTVRSMGLRTKDIGGLCE